MRAGGDGEAMGVCGGHVLGFIRDILRARQKLQEDDSVAREGAGA